MVSDGGLISYGIDQLDLYRRAPAYVDRILRGANPADLPVQLPTKFELAVNFKTAKVGDLFPRPCSAAPTKSSNEAAGVSWRACRRRRAWPLAARAQQGRSWHGSAS